MTAPAQVDALLNDGTHELPSMNRDFHSGTALPRIAVLIPCYNEAAAIATVVADFQRALPTATIYVYDNNSSDDTVKVAAQAGAIVRAEPLQGKGNVVRRMFADIEAEVYVLVDGDGTYDASAADANGAVCCSTTRSTWSTRARVASDRARVSPRSRTRQQAADRHRGHDLRQPRFGTCCPAIACLSRRFVKSFPALATGFETETELTVHALELRLPIAEIETPYRDRPTRLAEQAAHVRRRVQDPSNDCLVGERGTATAVLLAKRSVAGDDIGDCSHGRCSPTIWRPDWYHACRRRSWLPVSWCSRS